MAESLIATTLLIGASSAATALTAPSGGGPKLSLAQQRAQKVRDQQLIRERFLKDKDKASKKRRQGRSSLISAGGERGLGGAAVSLGKTGGVAA